MELLSKEIKYIPGTDKFKVTLKIENLFDDKITWNHYWVIVAFVYFKDNVRWVSHFDLGETGANSGDNKPLAALYRLTRFLNDNDFFKMLRRAVFDHTTTEDYRQTIEKWYSDEHDKVISELLDVQRRLNKVGDVWNNYREVLNDETTEGIPD